MTIQRKRVAKRLASGLLAGAMALGGLAISGGTASAVTPASPSTNRLGGSDRYATSVALANAYNASPTHVVVVSGENWADGLAAAPYASMMSAPIVLVGSDSLPGAVRDYFLVKNTSITGVTIIGGTSAVSDGVKDAIAAVLDTTDTITRISGADRYATMKAVATATSGANKVLDAADNLIIASGTSYADALSAAGWAFNGEFPILLTGSSALGADAASVVGSWLALPGSGRVILVGGTSVLSDQIIEDLVVLGVPYASITRIAGADRYATNTALNSYLYAGADTAYKGERVALINGAGFADALAAAPFLGKEDGNANAVHAVMVNDGIPAGAAGLVGTLAGTRAGVATAVASSALQSLYSIGGTSAVSEAVRTGVIAAAQAAGDVTTSIASCGEGATSVTVTFGKGAGAVDLEAIDNSIANFTINGVSLSGSETATATDVDGDGTKESIVLASLTALTAGQSVGFVGKTEAQTTNGRNLSAATCVVADDATAPTISVEVEPNAGGVFYLQASEPITGFSAFTDLSGVTLSAAGATCAAADTLTVTGGPTLFKAVISDADGDAGNNGACVITAADTFTIDVDNAGTDITDIAGNAVAADLAVTVGAADATAPSVTATYTCAAKTAGATALADAAGIVNVTGPKGAATNAYKVFYVNQRGRNVPSVVVDDAAKTITVTVDKFFHNIGDVINAFTEQTTGWSAAKTASGANSNLLAASLFAATTGVAVSTGNDGCSVTVIASEKTSALTVASPALNGISLGAVTAVGAAATPTSSTYTLNTDPAVVLGAGVVTVTVTATDIGGTSTTVTITATPAS